MKRFLLIALLAPSLACAEGMMQVGAGMGSSGTNGSPTPTNAITTETAVPLTTETGTDLVTEP